MTTESAEFNQIMNPPSMLEEEGVSLAALPVGAVVDVQTAHHLYRVENRGDGKILISGHPQYCPRPVMVDFHGSTMGANRVKHGFIGTGMKLEFEHPVFGSINTSRVIEISEAA